MTKKQSSTLIPTLYHDGQEGASDVEKVNLLNSFFCEQSTIDDQSHNVPPVTELPQVHHSLSTIVVSPEDVCDAIKLIDTSKASGPDLISPRLIREGAVELSVPLS